jgi:hypothetical protein
MEKIAPWLEWFATSGETKKWGFESVHRMVGLLQRVVEAQVRVGAF